MKFQFLILMLIVAVSSFIQFFDVSIFGVKPNFAIVAIAAASFFISEIWEGIFLIVLASFILKFAPYFESEILIFFIGGIIVMLFGRYLPWNHLINNLFLIFSYTLIFYLVLFPQAIISWIFLQEVFYNMIAGTVIFLGFSRFLKPR